MNEAPPRPGPRILREGEGGIGGTVARAALAPLGALYGTAMRVRSFAYARGLAHTEKVSVPVISVGNLTTGGTGKTPFTLWAFEATRAERLLVGVVTRGYGGDGTRNDEVEMMLARIPDAAIGVGGDRVAVARALLAREPGLAGLVLDDGFQHQRLARDLDVLLVDATDPFGGGHCLPRGLLREPVSAMRRADLVVITRADQAEPGPVADELRRRGYAGPRITAAHVPVALEPLDGKGAARPLSDLRGRSVRLLSAIAHPAAFRRTVESLGARVVEERVFPDHHRFLPADLPDLRDEAGPWCVTEKDAAKLRRLGVIDGWVLRAELRFVEGEAELRARILATLRARGSA